MQNNIIGVDAAIRREIIRIALERFQGASIENAIEVMEFDSSNIPGAKCEVEEYLNRAYMNKSEVALAMDVFFPKMPKGTELPVIVNIHGGGLVMGDRKMSRAYGRVLASRGYLVFNIEYRLAPRANVAEQLDDVCAGMDAIASHLIDFEVDFDRIFLTAASAGAYLSIYTAAMKRSKRLQEAVGYKPTRMEFRALGLVSGMFYTRRSDPLGFLLADQFYGSKRTSPDFLELMDPEHPEIVRNLPPSFLITSRGDYLNNYTLMYHNALKKAGKQTKLIYYGDNDLGHEFMNSSPTHPKSIDAIDRMLEWFEQVAAAREQRRMHTDEQTARLASVGERMESHEIINQKCWSFVRELNSVSEERLDAVALRDNRTTYTYKQMFRKWERYAEVFTGLGIGESAQSRVGVLGVNALEPTFCFYGLNMVGASASMMTPLEAFDIESLLKSIEVEKLTDFIISDIFAQPQFVQRLLRERERLGLRNIIILKSPYGGHMGNNNLEAMSVMNYSMLKNVPGLLFMDDLLRRFNATSIAYATGSNDDAAVIVHTSGTTNGIHKPIPLSDIGINEGAYRLMRSDLTKGVGPGDSCLLLMELSSAYALVDMLHLPLALGAQVVNVPIAIVNPKTSESFSYYGINYALLSPVVLDMYTEGKSHPDLSSIRVPIVGGVYLSGEERHRLNEVLHECGSEANIVNGYGLSEAAGAIIISPADREDDTIGYPLPGVEVRILDEEDETFHDLSEGPRRGVLWISSPSVSSGLLGDVEFFEVEEEDGKRWLNTFDLVDVNEDGSLTYVGRMNKFFINNDGVRFDAGLVETAIAKQPGIVAVGLAGEYDKFIHDTIPVLYATSTTKGKQALQTLRQALVNVFVNQNSISTTNLPGQCVICDDIPRTHTGKVDVHQIMNGSVKGERYMVAPVYVGKKLTDVRLAPAKEGPGTWAGIPKELDPMQRPKR